MEAANVVDMADVEADNLMTTVFCWHSVAFDEHSVVASDCIDHPLIPHL